MFSEHVLGEMEAFVPKYTSLLIYHFSNINGPVFIGRVHFKPFYNRRIASLIFPPGENGKFCATAYG
jgi:hypothetical protein